MPRRALIAIVTTVLALVLLLSFKTPDLSTLIAGKGTDLPAATSAPVATVPATLSPEQDDTGVVATPAPTASAAPAGAIADGTQTGPAVNTRYGPVQVQVTIANGKVIDVTALELPFDRPARRHQPVRRADPARARRSRPRTPRSTWSRVRRTPATRTPSRSRPRSTRPVADRPATSPGAAGRRAARRRRGRADHGHRDWDRRPRRRSSRPPSSTRLRPAPLHRRTIQHLSPGQRGQPPDPR